MTIPTGAKFGWPSLAVKRPDEFWADELVRVVLLGRRPGLVGSLELMRVVLLSPVLVLVGVLELNADAFAGRSMDMAEVRRGRTRQDKRKLGRIVIGD